MKFSIIVPVYNTNISYLSNCINSILNQTYKNYELIIIDDGSNKEVKEFLSKYKNDKIKIFYNENHGVSYSRNYGVSMATGEYIVFVDSDDELRLDYLELNNKIIEKENNDILISQVTFDKSNFLINNNYNYNGDVKKTLYDYYLSFDNKKLKNKNAWINRGPVARCIKTDIVKNTPFDENISFGEDVLWNFQILEKCNNIKILLIPTYFYNKNENSVTLNYRENFEEDMFSLLEKLINNLKNIDMYPSPSFSKACFEYYRIYLKLCLFNKKNKYSFKQKYSKLKTVSNKLFNLMKNSKISFKGLGLKAKILLILFKYKLYLLTCIIESR